MLPSVSPPIPRSLCTWLIGVDGVQGLMNLFVLVYLYVGGNERLERVVSTSFDMIGLKSGYLPSFSLVFPKNNLVVRLMAALQESLRPLVSNTIDVSILFLRHLPHVLIQSALTLA